MILKQLLIARTESSPVAFPPSLAPSPAYLEQLACMPVAGRLSEMFPLGIDAKTTTDALAMYACMRRYFDGQRVRQVVIVGEGARPFLGALVALDSLCSSPRRPVQVVSVDPALAGCGTQRLPANLHVVAESAERVKLPVQTDGGLLLVLIHAHVDLERVTENILGQAALQPNVRRDCVIEGVIACACCEWKSKQHRWQNRAPRVIYRDDDMHSREREIRVWY
jgi:hypothetical protein